MKKCPALMRILFFSGMLAGIGGCGAPTGSLEAPGPLPGANDDLTATLKSFRWEGRPSGTSYHISRGTRKVFSLSDFSTHEEEFKEKVLLAKDYVSANVSILVVNHSDKPQTVSSRFFVGQSKGIPKIQLNRIVGWNPNRSIDLGVSIEPGESTTLSFEGIVLLDDLVQANDLLLYQQSQPWKWKVPIVPGHDDLYADGGCFHTFKVRITHQEWMPVPSGTELGLADTGQSMVTKEDLAGLKLTLEITNTSTRDVSFKIPFSLTGQKGYDMGYLLFPMNAPDSENFPADGIPIPAGQTISHTFESKLFGYKKLANKQPLKATNPRYDMSFPIEPLPEHSILYGD